MFNSSKKARIIKAATLSVLSMLLAANTLAPAKAADEDEKHRVQLKMQEPGKMPIHPVQPLSFESDKLMVMVNENADRELVASALRDLHATVEKTIGEGKVTCLLLNTEKGKLDETESKLAANSLFKAPQKLFKPTEQSIYRGSNNVPTDPAYRQQWQLAAMDVFPAWAQARGGGVTIAIADSGCAVTNADLAGKLYNGVNVVTGANYATNDIEGHGTLVATSAAAIADNSLTVGPARDSFIFPINIAYLQNGRASSNDYYVAQAIYEAGRRGIRVLNISYGYDNAQYGYANERQHPGVWQMLRWYRDQCNGLAFFSAGNNNQFDPNPRSPYIIMVSALAPNMSRASFSHYGNSIWFTAPGESVVASGRDNRIHSIDGTSFASPLAASMAALIISKNPNLRNTQVLDIMQRSSINSTTGWNQLYGFGLPRASQAVRLTP